MADYIYLLQNRLTSAQRRAVEAVREAARAHGMTVFLVGGAVRDLTSGSPVRDLDFAVQGEVAALLEDLKRSGATVAGENAALSSVYLIFPGGVRAELAPALTVSYPTPGIPETQPATILDDLRRRDFTANAMAISLNEGSFGLLLDPLNGVADIENREIRLVSNYGFLEQPALLLRAARLSDRLGWNLEERTGGRYSNAKEEKYIQALPERDRSYELEEIFHEEDPLATAEYLAAEGWAEILFPAWSAASADVQGIERVRELIGQLEQLGIHVDPSPVMFPLLTAKLGARELAALKQMLARPGFLEQIDTLEVRSKELATQLTSKAAAAPSETWKLLFAAEPEVVLWLAYSSRSGAVQSKLKAFLNDWPPMRQRIPYALMQEMRISPDLPGYEQLLEDLFFAQIDGKLSTPEATRAFLEPFSPPAPAPQSAVRRRPAKAARRSRKVAQAVAPDTELGEDEDTVEGGANRAASSDEADTEEERPIQPMRPQVPSSTAVKKSPAKPREKTSSTESMGQTPLETVPPVPARSSETTLAAAKGPVSAAAKGASAKVSSATVKAIAAPVGPVPAKGAAQHEMAPKGSAKAVVGKEAASKAPAKSLAPASKKIAEAKKSPASKGSPTSNRPVAKAPAKANGSAKKVNTSHTNGKGAPQAASRSAAKAPAKAVSKATSKSASKAPAKAAPPRKGAVVRPAVKAAAAKNAVGKARTVAPPAKRTAPAKKGAKAAPVRGRR